MVKKALNWAKSQFHYGSIKTRFNDILTNDVIEVSIPLWFD